MEYDLSSITRMVCYIDGDNAPGSRTRGIECLSTHDTVKLFYNEQSNYYKELKNRKALLDQGLCQVEFIETQNRNNAVDFAMCIDAAKLLARENSHTPIIYLISSDKHINVIAKQLAESFLNVDINTAGTIEEAYLKGGCLSLSNICDLKRFLVKKYGKLRGDWVFRNIEKLFKKEE